MHEAVRGDCSKPGQNVGTTKPVRVGLVLSEAANADEPTPAASVQQTVELLANVGGCDIDIADDSGDQRFEFGEVEQLLGLGDVGDRLHDDGAADVLTSNCRLQVGDAEVAAKCRHLGPGHPGLRAGCKIPEMVVGVDAQGHCATVDIAHAGPSG